MGVWEGLSSPKEGIERGWTPRHGLHHLNQAQKRELKEGRHLVNVPSENAASPKEGIESSEHGYKARHWASQAQKRELKAVEESYWDWVGQVPSPKEGIERVLVAEEAEDLD